MGFGNLGIWEILVIAVIILLFFGPRRLPEIARSMGGAMREFKRGLNEIQREFELAENEEGSRREREDKKRERPESIEPRTAPAGAVSTDERDAADEGDATDEGAAAGPEPADAAEAEHATAPVDPSQSDLFGTGRS